MRGLVAAGIPIFLLSALPGCSCAIKHVGLMEATRAIRGMTPGTSGGALFRQLQKQESATEFGYDTSAWFVYRKEGEGGASQSKTRTVYDDFEKVTWVSKYLVKMQRALRPLGRRLEGEAGVNGTSATPSTATSNSNVSGNAFSHKVQEGAAEAASTDETRYYSKGVGALVVTNQVFRCYDSLRDPRNVFNSWTEAIVTSDEGVSAAEAVEEDARALKLSPSDTDKAMAAMALYDVWLKGGSPSRFLQEVMEGALQTPTTQQEGTTVQSSTAAAESSQVVEGSAVPFQTGEGIKTVEQSQAGSVSGQAASPPDQQPFLVSKTGDAPLLADTPPLLSAGSGDGKLLDGPTTPEEIAAQQERRKFMFKTLTQPCKSTYRSLESVHSTGRVPKAVEDGNLTSQAYSTAQQKPFQEWDPFQQSTSGASPMSGGMPAGGMPSGFGQPPGGFGTMAGEEVNGLPGSGTQCTTVGTGVDGLQICQGLSSSSSSSYTLSGSVINVGSSHICGLRIDITGIEGASSFYPSWLPSSPTTFRSGDVITFGATLPANPGYPKPTASLGGGWTRCNSMGGEPVGGGLNSGGLNSGGLPQSNSNVQSESEVQQGPSMMVSNTGIDWSSFGGLDTRCVANCMGLITDKTVCQAFEVITSKRCDQCDGRTYRQLQGDCLEAGCGDAACKTQTTATHSGGASVKSSLSIMLGLLSVFFILLL